MKNKRVEILIVILFIIMIGCITCKVDPKAFTVNIESDTSDSLTIFEDTIVKVEPVDSLYPSAVNLPMKILFTGFFHADEVSRQDVEIGWFGLFQNENTYYMTPTSISVRQSYDGVLDEDEHDPNKWTGWKVSTVNIDTCLFLISGNPKLDSYEVKHLYGTNGISLGLTEHGASGVSFDFNTITYSFFATGNLIKMGEANDVEQNYRLFIKETKDGIDRIQLLAATPFFEGKQFTVLFTGDIDNDGLLDLIIDTSNHYNLFRPSLYLSSYATGKDEIVKLVAIHESVGY